MLGRKSFAAVAEAAKKASATALHLWAWACPLGRGDLGGINTNNGGDGVAKKLDLVAPRRILNGESFRLILPRGSKNMRMVQPWSTGPGSKTMTSSRHATAGSNPRITLLRRCYLAA